MNTKDELGLVEPEIIVLSGQTPDEVKNLLKVNNDPVKDNIDNLKISKSTKYNKNINVFQKEKCEVYNKIEEDLFVGKSSPRLIFEDAPDCDVKVCRDDKPVKDWDNFKYTLDGDSDARVLAGLEQPQHEEPVVCKKSRLNEDFDKFCSWRKAAGIKTDFTADVLNTTKSLMGIISAKLSASFPDIKFEWTAGTWNPRILINSAPSHICLEKLAVAYKGLTSITDESNAQVIIANIVLKKMQALFI